MKNPDKKQVAESLKGQEPSQYSIDGMSGFPAVPRTSYRALDFSQILSRDTMWRSVGQMKKSNSADGRLRSAGVPGIRNTLKYQHENKILLVLTLIIGAVVGLVVVAFIVLTENLGARMYPAGGAAWRRVLVPVIGAAATGFLLFRYFPNARGSGIPQTKTALFLRDGFISFRTVLGI